MRAEPKVAGAKRKGKAQIAPSPLRGVPLEEPEGKLLDFSLFPFPFSLSLRPPLLIGS